MPRVSKERTLLQKTTDQDPEVPTVPAGGTALLVVRTTEMVRQWPLLANLKGSPIITIFLLHPRDSLETWKRNAEAAVEE